MPRPARVDPAPAGGAGRRPTWAPLPTGSPARALVLLAPALVLAAVFVATPLAKILQSSLHLSDPLGRSFGPLTLDNYRTVLAEPATRNSLAVTALLVAVKVPLQLALGLGAALLLERLGPLSRLIRVLSMVPAFLPVIVVTVTFGFLFDRDLGLVNAAIRALGGDPVAWLSTPRGAQLVVLLVSLWTDLGLVLLVYLGGLAAVPATQRQAASVDGASGFQTFRWVLLPQLRRTTVFVAILSTILGIQLVVPAYALTKGGPVGATNTAGYEAYTRAFELFDWGPASAFSVLVLLLSAALLAAQAAALKVATRAVRS